MCLLSALVHVLITNFVPGFGCGGKGPGNENENEKSEDYSKADLKKRVLFFITVFRLAIPAFFRFTAEEGWYGQPKYCYKKNNTRCFKSALCSLRTSRSCFFIFWLI